MDEALNLLLYAAMLVVFDQPHDFDVGTHSGTRAECQMPSDRILALAESLRKRLVDDRHSRSPGRVTLGEFPSRKQRDSHGREEARPHRVCSNVGTLIRSSLITFDGHVAGRVAVRKNSYLGGA